jgi:hypothetical protein
MKPIAQQFVDDVSKVVDKYRDEGITIAETIGGLELIKIDLWSELSESAAEDKL